MGIESRLTTSLAEAVRKVGSQSAFARLIGRSQTFVYQALEGDKPLPAEHVLTVERETGISRHALRPDLYPDESDRPATRPDRPAPHDEAARAR